MTKNIQKKPLKIQRLFLSFYFKYNYAKELTCFAIDDFKFDALFL